MRLAAAAPIIPWTDLAYCAHAERQHARLRGRRSLPRPHRGREAEPHQRPLSGRLRAQLLRAPGRRPGRRPDELEERGSTPASRTTATRSSRTLLERGHDPPLLLLHRPLPAAGAAPDRERLHRRPLPAPTRRCATTTAPGRSTRTRRIALFFGDFGHPRAQGKADAAGAAATRASTRWFDYYVKGAGAKPFQGVEAFTQTCPGPAPSGGPFRGGDVGGASPRARSASTPASRRRSRRPAATRPIGQVFDPMGGGGACAQAPRRRRARDRQLPLRLRHPRAATRCSARRP